MLGQAGSKGCGTGYLVGCDTDGTSITQFIKHCLSNAKRKQSTFRRGTEYYSILCGQSSNYFLVSHRMPPAITLPTLNAKSIGEQDRGPVFK